MLLRLLSSITYRMVEKTKAIIMQEDISDVANGTYLVEVFRSRVVPWSRKVLGSNLANANSIITRTFFGLLSGHLKRHGKDENSFRLGKTKKIHPSRWQ